MGLIWNSNTTLFFLTAHNNRANRENQQEFRRATFLAYVPRTAPPPSSYRRPGLRCEVCPAGARAARTLVTGFLSQRGSLLLSQALTYRIESFVHILVRVGSAHEPGFER